MQALRKDVGLVTPYSGHAMEVLLLGVFWFGCVVAFFRTDQGSLNR